MPVLVLRHEPFEHLGRFAAILQDRQVPFCYLDLGQPGTLDGYTGMIIMGGPMSANDALPALAAELTLIQQALDFGIPVLGICLGAQLIAKALGGCVYANPVKEIGWAAVQFTPAGIADPIFRGIPSPSTFFHWHRETFDLPAGTDCLAYSDQCCHQAFRYGTRVYGIQFHPEVTPEMVADWSSQPVNCGDVADLVTPIDPHAVDTGPTSHQILEAWLRML